MLREEFDNIKSTKSDLRKFGVTVGIAFIFLAFILLRFHRPTYMYVFGIGTFFLFAGMLIPMALKVIQRPWMAASLTIGWVMTHLLMGVVFLLLVTPFGFLSRIFGKQYLDLKTHRDADSYWRFRDRKMQESSQCEKQY